MQFFTTLAAAVSVLSTVSAHMSLSYPAPFRTAINPFANQATIDYTPTAPLSGAAQFPCKGYQSDLGTPAGKAVTTWAAGSTHNFTVLGSAVHGGGSCQAALSADGGKSWKVIHSYIGSCPLNDGQNFNFDVPSDTPATGSSGTIFAWLWYNEIGNREIYMSCASVEITSGSTSRAAPAVAFDSRPDLFVANLANGCTTVEGKEVQFPNPGPDADVTLKNSVADNSGSFTGTCAAVDGIGGEAAGSSGSPSPAGSESAASSSTLISVSSGGIFHTIPTPSASSSSQAVTSAYSVPGFGASGTPTSISSSAIFFTLSIPSATSVSQAVTPVSSVASAPSSTGTSSAGGLTVSEDGECSGTHTCTGSTHGPCCSQWGWCGSTDSYCGTGCMSGFGQCGTFVNSTSSATPAAKRFRIRGSA